MGKFDLDVHGDCHGGRIDHFKAMRRLHPYKPLVAVTLRTIIIQPSCRHSSLHTSIPALILGDLH
jgi:hypothetical protein